MTKTTSQGYKWTQTDIHRFSLLPERLYAILWKEHFPIDWLHIALVKPSQINVNTGINIIYYTECELPEEVSNMYIGPKTWIG